jgi:hypothetical protein
MLRFTIALVVAMFISDAAMSADRTLPQRTSHHVRHRTAVILPEGLPRRHYRFRTTISYRERYVQQSGPRLSVYENPRALYSPDYAEVSEVSYTRRSIRTPVLPAYSAVPGYYERAYPYDDVAPYYDGAYVSYWGGLPYGCGIYSYC